MKKFFKIVLLLVFVSLIVFAGWYVVSSNSKSPVVFETETAFKTDIQETEDNLN